MMSCEERKFPYSFFILLTQSHKFSAPKLKNFLTFVSPLPLTVAFFQRVLI